MAPISDIKALPFLKIGPPVELPGALRGFLSGALLDTGQREGQRNLYDLLVSDLGKGTKSMLTEGKGYNVFKSVMETGLTVRKPQIDMSVDLLELVFPRPNWPLLVRDAQKLIYDTQQEVVIWFIAMDAEGLIKGDEYCLVGDKVCKRITHRDIGVNVFSDMRSVRGDMLVYYVNKIDVSEGLLNEIEKTIADVI